MAQANQPLTVSEKMHKLRSWITLCGLCGVALLTLVFLLLWDDPFYVSQTQPNTRAFAANATTDAGSAAVTKTIDVWVDTNPNMYGFVASTHTGCVPSAYRSILLNLSVDLKDYALSTTEQYHYFNLNTQGLMEESNNITEESYYQSSPSPADDVTRMAAILETQTGDMPSLFFTDFESFNAKDFQAALKTVAEKLFEQGKSIRVDAYRSAFGGTIYNYAATNENVFYGYDGHNSKVALQASFKNTPYFHYMPRPFYILTVGTESDCETIGSLLETAYNKVYSSLSGLTCGGKHNLDDYRVHDEFSFTVKTPTAQATLTAGKATGGSVGTLSSDITMDSSGNQNVYGFTVQHKLLGNQTLRLPFTLTPQISGIGNSFFIKVVQPLTFNIDQVTQNHTLELDKTNPEQYLEARGNRYIRLSLDPLTDHLEGFSVVGTVQPNADVNILFSVDMDRCDKGLYRVQVPVTGKPDLDRNATATDYLQQASWNLSRQDAANAVSRLRRGSDLPSNGFTRTIDFDRIISALHNAFIESESIRTFPVGQILFDLRIQ